MINDDDQSVVAEDGWIDYAPDNIDTVEQIAEDKERHGEKFNLNEYNKSLASDEEDDEKTAEKPKKSGFNFVVPKQIQSVGKKIKNLFMRHTRTQTMQPDNSPNKMEIAESPQKSNREVFFCQWRLGRNLFFFSLR